MIILLSLAGALTTVAFVLLVFAFIRRRTSMDIFHRLRRHYAVDITHVKQQENFVQSAYKVIQRMAKPIADLNISKILEYKLRQAGIPLFGAEAFIIAIIAAIFASFVAYVVTLNITVIPMVATGLLLFMWFWLKVRINKRRQAFTEQLGDCLTTVSNALRAGYSFQQAMDVVSKEMEPPISTEFERVSTDVAMGVTLETALEQMNQRIGSADFDLVVTAVLIQREIGGNLAQILDTISYTINERIRMKREINALTAQGRFSAWVLMLLPVAVAVFCWFFNNDQMQLFITEESGRIAIAFSIIMEILGFIIIQKIVDIEV